MTLYWTPTSKMLKSNSALDDIQTTGEEIKATEKNVDNQDIKASAHKFLYLAKKYAKNDPFSNLFSQILEIREGWTTSSVITYPSQTAASTLTQTRNRLKTLYLISNKQEVFRFLAHNPGIDDLLLEAHENLEQVFGPNLQMELRVAVDPEVEGLEELFGYIMTDLPVEEGLAKLDLFDERWFLDAIASAGGKLNFNLRFL